MMIKQESLDDLLKDLLAEHPYKVPGRPETYSDYNQGWVDALYRVDSWLDTLKGELT